MPVQGTVATLALLNRLENIPTYLIFGYRNLSQDYDNVEEVNRQLEKMGFNIGVRIVEDFLARTNSGKCTDLR